MAVVAMSILVGAIMIKRSSIIASDGQRYFALIDLVSVASVTRRILFAGVVPYYSQRKAIDPLGRVDPYIATLPAHQDAEWGQILPGHNKYDLGYSPQTERPTAIIVDAWGACTRGKQDLRAWCQENYHLVRVGMVQVLLENNSPQVQWEGFASKLSVSR